LSRAAAFAESHPSPSRETSEYARLLEDLSANAGYSALVSAVAGVSALAVSITSSGWQEHALAAMTVAVFVHLGTTLLLVSRRVFLLTVTKLNAARTDHADRDAG